MPAKFPKHAKAVALARKEIGVHEDPWGSNRGRRVEEYQAADWLTGGGYAWCASFCCFIWKKAGFDLKYLGAGAYKWYDDGAKYVGHRIPRDQWPHVVPGDGVVFRIGSGHIGIVEKIVDGAVHSIDGNSGDQVAARIRPMHLVYGFIHLNEKAVTPPRPPRVPMYEVVTSESGSKALVTRKGKVIYVSGEKAIAKRLGRFLKKYGAVTIRRKK
jgi:hypothetical protein